MRSAALVPFALLALACGGAESSDKSVRGRPGQATPKPPVIKAQPVEFSVQAVRVGSAVHLEVTGTGRGHLEGGAFENPESWTVRVWIGGQELARVVNGSARVERSPVGSIEQDRWDVTVIYSVGFAMSSRAAEVEVEVAAPGATRFRDKLELEVDEDAAADPAAEE